MSLGLPPPKLKMDDLTKLGAASWIEPLVRSYNQLRDYLQLAFDGGATLEDNIAGTFRTLEIRTGTGYTTGTLEGTTKFDTGLMSVRAVFVLRAVDKDFPDDVLCGPLGTNWSASGGLVTLRYVAGLQKSHRYTLSTWCF